MKVVLDTYCLLPSIFKKSPYYWLWDAFIKGDFSLCYSSEILKEYGELLTKFYSAEIAVSVTYIIQKTPNSIYYPTYYSTTNDPDDNKFLRCTWHSVADYIVTNDNLKELMYPWQKAVAIESFKAILNNE
ncbi:MAG: putative toxin-antitoxin system toxin component, PIN family [Bacteroidales bacterium]|jgi:putative PIN family toxin of toxin-antitoxin system|nr:putative toxin-antitoxin system toxin component, PIN family [Bacteroidales bacterium]